MSRLYPDIIYEEDLSLEAFEEVDDSVEAIDVACAGWGTDEALLIQALGSKTQEERFKIYYRFNQLKEKDLAELIESECSRGDLGLALQFMSVPNHMAECKMIKNAIEDLGTKEGILYPILCGRSNTDMDILKKTYYKVYEDDLPSKLSTELGGDFERLVFNCLQAIEEEYDPEHHTPEKAEEDAAAFYDAGQGAWGTDEAGLFKLICAAPPEHLIAVSDLYAEKYGRTLQEAVLKELSGTEGDAAHFAIGMKINPYETIAAQINHACGGVGTNELALTCALIRYQKLFPEVKEAHEKLYEKTLLERVEGETGGQFAQLLSLMVDSS